VDWSAGPRVRTTVEAVALAAREWPRRTVRVDGTDLCVREVPGTAEGAEPVVFVHGLGGSSLNFTAIGLLLADAVRGIAVDLPGFGRSAPRDGPSGITDHAELLAEFIDAEVGTPVHLVGNSMGGAIAVRLAARRPDLVRTLTLISPALPDQRPRAVAAYFMGLATPRLGAAIMRRNAKVSFERRMQIGLSLIFGDHRLLPPEVVDAYKAELRWRDGQPWFADALLAGARSIVAATVAPPRRSLWADAARIRCPVLLVYGGRDRLVDARVRNRAQAAFPDARLLYLPESGHVAQIEHPLEVAEAFRHLIRAV
jgi:pimeloyl-ACP methyl ester carboxylesterase